MKKQNTPIAIVGIGCRYPGEASSPDKFWDLMVNKKDAIIDVPKDRWDHRKFYDATEKKAGKMRILQGGFLKEGIKQFDPLFFGISPVEAESLDPQISLMLEVAYEALENSGITLENIKNTKTGVFVGGFTVDNYVTTASHENNHLVNSHSSLGSPLTMLSNKISYCFDLKGPSITIDTACSSSLVATHYACQSIWNGESNMALVGGVNAMLIPQTFVLMSQGKFLSKHGRCKSFDSDAAGYVRGEGAGVVVLKPYDQAIKDGDRIYALVNGTGVNQDGQTNGITVPNRNSQVALMRQVYDQSGVDSKEIDYVEAHGTGTPVGDPLEFGAINEVMSENRNPEDKLFVGSVKSNIGHLEAGAGVAGLIKAALSLHNNQVPANLHFNEPNPALNYENSVLKVPTKLEQLPEGKESYASINSFGFGGTNAHVLLKQFTDETETKKDELKKNHILFPITAKSKDSLVQRVASYRKYMEKNQENFAEILSNVVHRTSFHSNRLGVFATSQDDLLDKLEAFEEEISVKGVAEGTAMNQKPKVAYVYTGMGPQWWKMGRELMETEPVFLAAIEACDEVFQSISGWSILEELQKPEDQSRVTETNVAQTANFVVQVGLTKLLAHYGVTPDAVVGHSVGEVTSLYISGAMSLEDALMVSYHRSRLQASTAGSGVMLAVGLSEKELEITLEKYDDVSVAAINSNKAVTLSGGQESLEELAEQFKSMDIFNRMLDVEVPYHSPMMNPIKQELLESLQSLEGKETTIDLYSTVTASKIPGTTIDNQYWWRNVREPVRFAKTFETLVEDDYKVFIEVGPHPVLKNSMMEGVGDGGDFHFVQTLNRKESEALNFYENLATLFTLGYDLKWDRWVAPSGQVTLPKYNWDKMNYWTESKVSASHKLGLEGNNFLNDQVESSSKIYRSELSEQFFPFLADHVVQNRVVFPGAGYISAAIALHQNETGNSDPFGLENIKFHQLLALNDDEVQQLYISLNPESNKFEISNKEKGENTPWFKRATGKCIFGKFTLDQPAIDTESLYINKDLTMSAEAIYNKLSKAKLEYGPFFRGIKSVHYNSTEAVAKIEGCEAITSNDEGHFIHPGLLDSAFQTMIVFDENDDVSIVPVSVGRIMCYSSPGTEFTCHTRLKKASFNTVMADITIYNNRGEVAMEIEGIKCQEIGAQNTISDEFLENSLHEINWVEEEVKFEFKPAEDKTYAIITDNFDDTVPLTMQLDGQVLILQPGTAFRELGDNHYEVDLANPKPVGKLIEGKHVELMYFSGAISDHQKELISTEECLELINPVFGLVRYLSKAFPKNLTLNFLTVGGQAVLDEDKIQHLGTAVYIGLGRLMINEFPNWKIRLIDFEVTKNIGISGETWKVALAKMNTAKRSFEELAIRQDRVYTKVMRKRAEQSEDKLLQRVNFADMPLELVAPQFSDLENLHYQRIERVEPNDQEVEIRIENTGINFKDYLKVTSKISTEAFEGTNCEDKIGIDCEGVITKVGKDVSRFKVGDKVIGISKGAFKSYTTINEKLIEFSPKGLDGYGSHIICPYLTAVYGLGYLANLQRDERILIHNATGAVGLAAINYANMVGAEVFATAGSEEKRDYLRSMGVEHVFSSKDLDFSNKISKITEGDGVNVVLSALAGEMMYQSLEVLAPYGRYLEMGKLSAIEDMPLPMRIFKRSISFTSMDIDQLCKDKPELVSQLLKDAVNYLDSGKLAPIPVKVFNAENIVDAFQWIEDRNYIGKTVVNFKDQSVEIEHQSDDLFKADRSYLITGGTRGLGLEIAHWLVGKGVKNLCLLSRSGEKNPEVKAKIDVLRDQGATINVYGADVANRQEMAAVFANIESELPPLAGIFHGAMVLDDGFLLDMNDDRFMKVLNPKVNGTMNLHELSKSLDLDVFVMFSSLSSLIGHLGQANYVVANTLLDSFAHLRNNLGLPATTVNLGILGQSGVIARDENLKEMVMDAGIRSFTNEEVLIALEEIVRTKPTQIGFFDLDWEVFEKSFKSSKSSLFEELIKENVGSNNQLNEVQSANWNALKGMTAPQQKDYMLDLLKDELSLILKMPKGNIPHDKGVNFFGLDSILSVQLIRAVNAKLAVELSPMEFTSGPNLQKLTKTILDKFYEASIQEEVLEKAVSLN